MVLVRVVSGSAFKRTPMQVCAPVTTYRKQKAGQMPEDSEQPVTIPISYARDLALEHPNSDSRDDGRTSSDL